MSKVLEFFGLDTPSPSPSPTDDYWYGPIGGKTLAGVDVNEVTALNYSVCWAATRLLAGTAGWLPLNLYRKLMAGGAEIAGKHYVHTLIHDWPNPDMGSMMFRARGVNHQVNWGNCFAEIVRDGAGRASALWPIHPSRVPQENLLFNSAGELEAYRVNQRGGPAIVIPKRDMFHVASIISDDGIYGKGVVTAAREAIGKAVATQTHGSTSMRHPVPPIVIKNGKFRDEAARTDFRRQWSELHGGPDKAGRPALLPENAEVQQLGFNLKDSQFIESQQFDIEEIARWYGVPPHMIGHLLRSTHNNIEHQGIEFVKYSLMPWLKLWEIEIRRKLLTDSDKSDHYAKFVVDALERGDKPSRTAASVQEFFNGLLTINQWAEREDMNPIGPAGDVHFVQQAMIPLERAVEGPPEPPPPPAPEPEPDDEPDLAAKVGDMLATYMHKTELAIADLRTSIAERLQPPQVIVESQAQHPPKELLEVRDNQRTLASAMIRDVMGRMLAVEVNGVKRVAEKASKFDARLREFYGKHAGTMERALAQPLAVWWEVNGLPGSPAVAAKLVVDRHIKESTKQLDSVLSCTADELHGTVESLVASWTDERLNLDIPHGTTHADELSLMMPALIEHQDRGMAKVAEAIANQPAPVIHVAAPVVNVPESPPPVVTVNLPPAQEFDIEPVRDAKTGLPTRYKRVPKE